MLGLEHLDEDFVSAVFQADLIVKYLAATPRETHNIFQEGDLVLIRLNPDQPLPTKLSSPFLGPHPIIQQLKSDAECRHLVISTVKWFYVIRLKLFHGTKDKRRATRRRSTRC